jgi:23S rRNA pseudouridine1911/1915/1917 synthase
MPRRAPTLRRRFFRIEPINDHFQRSYRRRGPLVMTDAPLAAGRHAFTLDDAQGERLDLVVAHLLDTSRTQAATLIAGGHVTVDGRRERASFRAERGASVEVDVPPRASRSVVPESIPLTVVLEDDHLLVVDKPAGMVVHPAPGHWSGTLVNALLGRGGPLAEGTDPARAGLVHRLDKDTSGLIVVAKTDRAIRALSSALAARRIVRRYAALSWGHFDEDRRRVDAAVGRDPRNRKRMAILEDGRRAVTDFTRIARFDSADLLRAHLHTGRTHQIRVHLASIGHPVVGDTLYGGAERKVIPLATHRQFLHAAWLRFRHPVTDVVCDVRSELPADLRATLARAAKDPGVSELTEPLAHFGFFGGHG